MAFLDASENIIKVVALICLTTIAVASKICGYTNAIELETLAAAIIGGIFGLSIKAAAKK